MNTISVGFTQDYPQAFLEQMGLNERISERLEFALDASRDQILDAIASGKLKQKNIFVVDAFDFINYKRIKVTDNRMETLLMPTVLNPFRPHGRITIDIIEEEAKRIKLTCVILPSDGIFPVGVMILIGFLTFWSAFALLLSWGDLKALFVIIPGWLGTGLMVYLGLLYNKSALRRYTKRLIDELEGNVK